MCCCWKHFGYKIDLDFRSAPKSNMLLSKFNITLNCKTFRQKMLTSISHSSLFILCSVVADILDIRYNLPGFMQAIFPSSVICTPVISEEKITSNDRHKVMALDLSSFFWPGELNKNFKLKLYGRTDHRRVKKRKYYISKQQEKI